VHIGKNSFTIEDTSTSSSGKDEIASSINALQIGTSTSHNTTVLGTLSVQTPTANNHATTKAYVDTATNSNTTNISTNTNSIATNNTNINAIQSKNTSQDSAITSNTVAAAANTNLINSNTDNINTNLGLININIDKITNIETGLAQSMAMGALSTPSFGKSNFSIATGNYNGTHAVAYGFSHHDSEQDIIYRLLGSQSGNISSSAASIGWSF
jgi:hypothetical protein